MSEVRYRVRALDRALLILRILNQHNGLNASEMSRLTGLPRPTVIRILMTLSDGGYVMRCESDGCYRATLKVRELSCGYQEETGLGAIVRPFLARQEAVLIWPLAVVRLQGTRLIVEALTDHMSRMFLRRESPGLEVSASMSASAHLHMALGDDAQRRALIDYAFTQGRAYLDAHGWKEADVFAAVERAREKGYAVTHLAEVSSISVPVWIGGALYCALNMRFHGPMEMRLEDEPGHVKALLDAAGQLATEIAPVVGAMPGQVGAPRARTETVESAR